MKTCCLLAVCATLCGLPLAGCAPAQAQPTPSFQATCGQLRAALAALGTGEEGLVTIEVSGRLTMVRSDGALVYLVICSAPDPQVLCVTYADNGRKVGDEVVMGGAYGRVGPDHVKLDPCLHYLPRVDGKRR